LKAISGVLDIPQEVYLRALTGYLVERNLLADAGRTAIIALPDRICMSIAAAIAASRIASVGYDRSEGLTRIYQFDDNIDETTKRVVEEFKADIVVLMYGGEHRLSEVKEATLKTLRSLARAGFRGTLIIHVRILLATNRLNDFLQYPDIVDYLRSLREVRTFTADLQNKKFVYHRVKVVENRIEFEKLGESSLTDEHVSLLKASLPPA